MMSTVDFHRNIGMQLCFKLLVMHNMLFCCFALACLLELMYNMYEIRNLTINSELLYDNAERDVFKIRCFMSYGSTQLIWMVK